MGCDYRLTDEMQSLAGRAGTVPLGVSAPIVLSSGGPGRRDKQGQFGATSPRRVQALNSYELDGNGEKRLKFKLGLTRGGKT
jgi:hypothetical protein